MPLLAVFSGGDALGGDRHPGPAAGLRGIFAHSLDLLHNPFPWLPDLLYEFVLGLVPGFVVLVFFKVGKRLLKRS